MACTAHLTSYRLGVAGMNLKLACGSGAGSKGGNHFAHPVPMPGVPGDGICSSEVQTLLAVTRLDAQPAECTTVTDTHGLLLARMAGVGQGAQPYGSGQPAIQAVCGGPAAAL